MDNGKREFEWLRRWLLVLVLVAGALALLLRQVPPQAQAYDDYPDSGCNGSTVFEGDTSGGQTGGIQPYQYAGETLKLYWTSYENPADETEYSPLRLEGRAGNGYQTENIPVGRPYPGLRLVTVV